jgi:hypothetical protein
MAMPSGQKITTGQSQLLKLSSGLLNQKNHRFSLKNQDGNLAELWEVVLTLLDKVRIFWVPALHFFHAPKTHKKKRENLVSSRQTARPWCAVTEPRASGFVA